MDRMTLFPPHPEPFPEEMEWRGWMIRAIDGDTYAVKLDVGFRISLEADVRLQGIDTPEMVGADKAAGIAARDFVNLICPPGTPLRVFTTKMRRSFNRYVANILFWNGSAWVYIGGALIDAGHGTATQHGEADVED